MSKFKKQLQEYYLEEIETGCVKPESKIDFIGEFVFCFDTYDPDISIILSNEMLSVLHTILNRCTFEYIEDKDRYKTYITMVNMPFLKGKLEWGGSIRGAWLDYSESYTIDFLDIEIKKGEIESFVKELIEWSEYVVK